MNSAIWKVLLVINKFIQNPYFIFRQPCVLDLMRSVSDETFLKLQFRARIGRKLDLNNPRSFNEKLQWLKVHDHNPLYPTLVDKYAVKKWVAAKIGSEHVSKTYGKWEQVEEIDLNLLPDRFVLKTNHDSGGVAICSNRSEFDFDFARKSLDQHLKTNYYWRTREYPYKSVRPLVFAEEYLESDASDGDLPDYKVLCFGGEPKFIEVHKGRFSSHTQDIYDCAWNRVKMSDWGYPQSDEVFGKPRQLELMLEFSELLSRGLPHVRVDWYLSHERLIFGEMTFYDGAGFSPFDDYADDLWLGSYLELPLSSASD